MARTRGQPGGSLLRRFVVLYIIVLAIPMLVGSVALRRGLDQLRSDLLAANLRSLDLNQRLFETELERVREIAIRIDRTNELRRLYSRSGPLSGSVPIWLLDAWNSVYANVILDSVLIDVIVVIDELNVIFTVADIYARPEIFTENFFSYGELTPAQVLQDVLAPRLENAILPATSISLLGRSSNAILLRQALPLEDPYRGEASVHFLLDAEVLRGRLASLVASEETYVAIFGPDGSAIVSNVPEGRKMPDVSDELDSMRGSFALRVDDMEYTAAYVRDPETLIGHVVLSPTRIFLRQAFNLQLIVVIAAIAALVLGVIVSIVFAYRTSKPLEEIGEALRLVGSRVTSEGSPLDFLSSSVEHVIANNTELRNAIQSQRPLAQMAVVERIMRDEYTDPSEARAALEQVRVTPFGSSYVAILVVGDYDHPTADPTTRKSLVRATLTLLLPGWPVIDRGDDELIAFAVSQSADAQAAENEASATATSILDELARLYGVAFRAFVGSAVGKVNQIGASLTSAQIARTHSPIDHGLVRAASARSDQRSVHYPINVESQLVAAVLAGDRDRAAGLVGSVVDTNYQRRALSEQEARWLHQEFVGTALRTLEYLRDQEQRDELVSAVERTPHAFDQESVRTEVTSMFTRAAEWFREQRGTTHTGLRDRLEEFLNENLLDHNLSLAGMADHAGVSEAYASSMFKEIFGENFAAYVERERLHLAQRLLVEEDYTVEQIASRVGYNSATSFRRAFKRRFGVPPTGRRGTNDPLA